jgi:hypothetical protein
MKKHKAKSMPVPEELKTGKSSTQLELISLFVRRESGIWVLISSQNLLVTCDSSEMIKMWSVDSSHSQEALETFRVTQIHE